MQRMGYYRLCWCVNLVSLVGRRPSAPPAIVLCPVRSSLDPSKCDRSASHQLPGPFPMCFLVFLFLWRFQPDGCLVWRLVCSSLKLLLLLVSGQWILRILLRHELKKVCDLLMVAFVLLHVSTPHSRKDLIFELNRWTLVCVMMTSDALEGDEGCPHLSNVGFYFQIRSSLLVHHIAKTREELHFF